MTKSPCERRQQVPRSFRLDRCFCEAQGEVAGRGLTDCTDQVARSWFASLRQKFRPDELDGTALGLGDLRLRNYQHACISILPNTSISHHPGMCSGTPIPLCAHTIPTAPFASFRPATSGATGSRDGPFTVPRSPSIFRLQAGLPFKSHSSPRPPQTPAASA